MLQVLLWIILLAAAPFDDPSDAVLTIRGVCSEPARPSAAGDCITAVSRRQFEDLLAAAAPGVTATAGMKQSFAQAYAEILAFEIAARSAGVDASPRYRETMQWLQRKTLADLYRRRLETEASLVSQQDIDAYYSERISQFEEVRLRRIVLPRSNFASLDPRQFEQDAQLLAAKLRTRASNGEDLDALQKEAYRILGFTGPPPSTEVGNRRRSSLASEASDEIFSLHPREVSGVQSETYSFVIYQVEAKWILPENQVREEIRRLLSQDRLDRALKSITGAIRTEFNQKYFGTPTGQ